MAVSTVQRRIVSLTLFAAGLSAVAAPLAARADEIIVGAPVQVQSARMVVAEPVALRTGEVVVAPNAPPPVRYEVVPATRVGYVWERGHWRWDHGRYVWIGGHWEALGKLQFDYLVANGLKPGHRLLDIGCGTLRGGRHFIRYLAPGGYTGIDISNGRSRAAGNWSRPRDWATASRH